MCGLLGAAGPGAGGAAALAAARTLADDLAARGPDGGSVGQGAGWTLAARRLAIQGDDRAAQPATSRDGRVVIAFNGEILGPAAASLRALLAAAGRRAPPPEAGDVPLLAEAVAALAARGLTGPDLAALLEGSMGALAVVERDARTTWLVRDRLGVKPLHVRAVGHDLWYGSLLAPLLRLGPRAPDPEGLALMARLHRPGARSPFAGVETVAPGAVWRVRPHPRGGRWHVTRWAAPLATPEEAGEGAAGGDEDAAVARLAEALAEAASAAAAVDGPVAVLLSGGLDAAAVAAWASRGDLLALTGRFGPPGGAFDESGAAALVARHLGLRHEVVDLGDEDLVADLEPVVRALELPVGGPGSLALWRMARRARAHGRVVLTGTGGDELLGGYARTALVLDRAGAWTEGYDGLAARIDAAGEDLDARRRAALDRGAALGGLLRPGVLPAVEPPSVPAAATAPVRRVLADEVEGTLPMLLHVEDRVTMAHGLEGRPPFCLGRVADAAGALPPDLLVGPDGEGKRALRRALAGRIPEAVRLDRRKRGFPTPFARAARGAGRARVEALLADRRTRERGWWDLEAARRALDAPRPDHDRGLFALLSWEVWARAFLDGDALGPEVNP